MNRSSLVLALVGLTVAALLGLFLLGGDAPAGGDVAAGDRGGDAAAAAAAPGGVSTLATDPVASVPETAADGEGGARRALAAIEEDEPDDEPQGPFLLGRVVDPGGRGVPNATVRFSNGTDIVGPGTVRLLGAVASRSKSGETDAGGNYRIEDPGHDQPTVSVSAPGFQPLEVDDLELPAGPGDRRVPDLVLEPGVILAGDVVDDRGAPVVGAELTLVDPDDDAVMFRMGGNVDPDGTTDDRGRFELDQVPLGAWGIQIRADGHPTRIFRGSAERVGLQPALRLEIPVGARITGRVNGVPEARREELAVRAMPTGAFPFAAMSGAAAGGEAEIDEDGLFELSGLDPARSYEVELIEPGTGMFAMMGGGASRSPKVTVDAGAQGVQLEFLPPAAVRFQAVDAATGRPVERFEASLGFAFNQRELTGPDGEPLTFHTEGRAVFTGLYADDFEFAFGDDSGLRVRVDAEGYASGTAEIEELEDGQELDLGRIELVPAPSITVLVRDFEDGEPLANARVELRPLPEGDGERGRGFMQRMDLASQTRRVKTGDDGRAVLTSIPGVVCRLEVDKGGRAPYVQNDLLVESTPVELEVRLGPGGDLVVEVIDDTGAPVGGAEVQHRGPGETEVRGTRSTSSRRGARFRDLEPGEHSFRVADGRDDRGRRWRRRVEGDGGDGEWTPVQVTHGFDGSITLVVEATHAVFGVVREAGRALGGATVTAIALVDDADDRERQLTRLRSGGGRWDGESGRTSNDGSFRIEGLERGRHALVVDHERRSMPEVVEFEIRGAETRLDVDLGLTIVRGRVVDEQGAPVRGVEVEALPAARAFDTGRRWRGNFDALGAMGVEVVDVGASSVSGAPIGEGVSAADGSFELEGVAHGVELRLRGSADFVVDGVSEPFTLEADQTLEGLEVVVSPAGGIEVTLTAPPGSESLRFVSVDARFVVPDDAEGGDQVANANGFSFAGGPTTLGGLRPGRWRVSARERGDGDRRSEEVTIDVRPGETTELTLLLD